MNIKKMCTVDSFRTFLQGEHQSFWPTQVRSLFGRVGMEKPLVNAKWRRYVFSQLQCDSGIFSAQKKIVLAFTPANRFTLEAKGNIHRMGNPILHAKKKSNSFLQQAFVLPSLHAWEGCTSFLGKTRAPNLKDAVSWQLEGHPSDKLPDTVPLLNIGQCYEQKNARALYHVGQVNPCGFFTEWKPFL